MNRTREYRDKYHDTLVRMFDLFKYGKVLEDGLEVALSLARDELERIKACPDATQEIIELCERGLRDTDV